MTSDIVNLVRGLDLNDDAFAAWRSSTDFIINDKIERKIAKRNSKGTHSHADASVSLPGQDNSISDRTFNEFESTASAAADLLPTYLFQIVRHYHDDFYISRSFETQLIVQLMAEGFLPIASKRYLRPKLHVQRCVIQLNPQSKLHISRTQRRKSKAFLISVNECFDEVVAGCHRQHGISWLFPPIVAAFREIHLRTKDVIEGGSAMIMENDSLQVQDVTPVRLYSVEVWNANTGKLVGGELGYSVGAIYSSLTGFSDEDAAGSVQLVALGKLLTKCGFEYWDLGMEMDYKRRLGAELMGRADFVTEVKRSRIVNKGVVLHCGGERRNAKVLIDWEQPRSMSHDTTYLQNGTSILRTVSDEE